jgi:PAS domain S-box-containing protein
MTRQLLSKFNLDKDKLPSLKQWQQFAQHLEQDQVTLVAEQPLNNSSLDTNELAEQLNHSTVEQLALQNSALQSAANGIAISDTNGDVIWVNEAFTQLTQFTLDELIGKNLRILKSGLQEDDYYKNLWKTIASGQVWQGEIINKRKDGTFYTEEMTITPVRASGKEITHYIAIKQDISERKQKEAQIKKNQQSSEVLTALLQISLEDASLDDLLQRALDLILGTPWLPIKAQGSIFLTDKDADVLKLRVQHKLAKPLLKKCAVVPFGHCLCGQAAASGEILFTNCVNEQHEIRYKGMVPHGHYNVPIWLDERVVGVINLYVAPGHQQDDQEVSFLEAAAKMLATLIKRKRAENALIEQRAFLRQVIDINPALIFAKDRNGRFTLANQAMADVYGVTVEELIGKTDSDFVENPERAEQFLLEDLEIMDSLEEKEVPMDVTIDKKGNTRRFLTTKRPLIGSDGVANQIVGVVTDVTQLAQMEDKIRQSLVRREQQVKLSIQIAQEIAAATNLHDLYQRVVTQVQEKFGYYFTQLLRYDESMDILGLVVGYGDVGQKMLDMNHSIPMGVGFVGMAADTKQSVLQCQTADDSNWQPNPLLPATRSELAVPIKLRDKVLGVLDVQSDQVDGITEDDQLLLEGLCGQVAIAIESTELRQEMEGRLRELNLLQRDMSREGWQKYQQTRSDQMGYQFDLAGLRQLTTQPQLSSENGNNGVLPQNLPKHQVMRPLIVRGEEIGHFGVEDDPERPLTDEEREIIDAVAEELSEALEAARLFEQTQIALAEQERLATELETVAQVSTAASTILEVEELLQSVVDLAKSSFNLYHVHIYLMNETNNKLLLKAGAGNIGHLMSLEGREINLNDESIVARAARTREGVLENNVRRTVDFLPHPLLPETRAEMALPLIVGGKLIGVLDLQSDRENSFTEEDLNVQTTLAAQISVAVENATQYAAQVETTTKLREVDQLKSEFLASMSHELRTPLNSIIGFADVLLEGLDGELNDRMEEDIGLIRSSGDHLRGLIGDILDMSKIEAGRMDLRYETIDMAAMAKDVVATAAPLAQEKQLFLHLDIDETAAIQSIQADRTRLRQILWNILGNAIKFTEKGSVTMSLQAQSNHLLCSVRDTGIGIKEEQAAAVFEHFRQIDGGLDRTAGGTGLGMPITKKLVELHGGEIWIESVYGQGSTFLFTIPYQPPKKRLNVVEPMAETS